MTQVKVKDSTFVRDINSKALLNTDKKALNEYLIKRNVAKLQKEEKEIMKTRLDNLEKDITEIKSLLLDLLTMEK